MTKQELIMMMGNEDRAQWVMERVLGAVKPDFVVAVLKAEAEAAKQRLKDKEESGYYSEFSEFPEGFNYWHASEEMQQRYDQNEAREYERCGDKQFVTFTSNMWVHAVNGAHKVR
jgi:hypothetical protein